MRREWTAKERAYLIAHAHEEAKVIGKALGRSAASIRMAKKRWGVAQKGYRKRHTLNMIYFYRYYNRGYSDPHIARLLGASAETIRRLRVSKGKPANGADAISFKDRDRRRKKKAEAARRVTFDEKYRQQEDQETEEELNAKIAERMKKLPKWWSKECVAADKQER